MSTFTTCASRTVNVMLSVPLVNVISPLTITYRPCSSILYWPLSV